LTAEKIIKIARKYVGNAGGETFWKAYGYNSRVPWCAIFQWYIFREAGASSLYYGGGKTAYVPALWTAAKAAGQTGNTPKPGDMVCYDWNANGAPDHVGLVVSATSTAIHTIEGNVGDKVVEMDRPRDKQILGYIHPEYTTGATCDTCPVMEALRALYNKLKEEDNK
jgi:hypothetical protein